MQFLFNKRLLLDYEVIQKFEAGIELEGTEVKAVRAKLGSLQGAYVTVRGGEAFLINAFIPPYQEKNAPKGYDPRQNRRLLVTKAEILVLGAIENQKGLTIAPVSMYSNGRKVKAEIAVVRGKKQYDKRQDLKKRTDLRDADREARGR